MIPSLLAIDHIHLYVTDRNASEQWYGRVLGLYRVESMVFLSQNGGPLTIANSSASVHLALFERQLKKVTTVIAFSTTAKEFLVWRNHLNQELGQILECFDHETSWSMYFTDLDGNPFEITCYDYESLKEMIQARIA